MPASLVAPDDYGAGRFEARVQDGVSAATRSATMRASLATTPSSSAEQVSVAIRMPRTCVW